MRRSGGGGGGGGHLVLVIQRRLLAFERHLAVLVCAARTTEWR
jgi:hypothetical protein